MQKNTTDFKFNFQSVFEEYNPFIDETLQKQKSEKNEPFTQQHTTYTT